MTDLSPVVGATRSFVESGIREVTVPALKAVADALGLKGATEADLILFAEVANRSGLDPFARQVYAIKRGGRLGFQTGIDGYRSIAARTGEYDGQDEPVYGPPCDCDSFLDDEGKAAFHPEHCTVRVYRKGMGRHVGATAYWHEYCPSPGEEVLSWTSKNGRNVPGSFKPKTGRARDDAMWLRMPRVMLAKVAEATALRKAFPYVYGGLYTDAEMDQADHAPSPQQGTPAPAQPSVPEAAQPASPEQQGEGDREGPSPAPGQTVISGFIDKMPDGITRDSFGMPRFKITIKADGKRYHAMTEGAIAESLVRDVKPQTGDDITVIGRYVERPWEKEGKTYQVKEIHDITELSVRESVLTPGDDISTPPEREGAPTTPTSDPLFEDAITHQDLAAHEKEQPADPTPIAWEDGRAFPRQQVWLTEVQRLDRPNAGPVIHGWFEFDGGRYKSEFLTRHDMDPIPVADTPAWFEGKAQYAAKAGRTLLLGSMALT